MARKSEKLAREARIAVEKWMQYFKYNIDQYHELHGFVLGRQWTDDEEDMLKDFKKIPLQFNKLGTLVNTLLGEQQQNTPQLQVVPLSNCDEQTAEIRQTVTKDTILSTDAKTVYQVAAHQAFVGGFGAFIVDTAYTHDRSFDQEIVYRAVKDATKVYWDIGAEHQNKIDGMRAGYIARMSRKKFAKVYGKDVEEKILKESAITQTEEEIRLATNPDTISNPFSFSWADDDSITIIHDYIRKPKKDVLYKLSNGDTLNQEEMDELIVKSREFSQKMQEQEAMMSQLQQIQGMEQMQSDPNQMMQEEGMPQDIENLMRMESQSPAPMPEMDMEMAEEEEDIQTLYINGEPVRIEESRDSQKSQIMHRVIAGTYVLEQSEFPSEDLPIIFVDQNSYYDKDGKQICRPFVIDAVDAQRYLNYLGTQAAYILKISRYDQFMGSKKNVASLDTQRNWRDPATIQGMITYDESPSGAKPEQIRPPELSVSLTQQYERAINDMYTSTGLYPTRLGNQGEEVSGAAIDARTRQGSYSTYVAFNSINRAISAGGQIVNQMIPRVYDTERVMNVMTPDRGRQNITVNQQMDEYGEVIRNDLRKGSFQVVLVAGPSYEGQKSQALESLNMVLQANPSLLNIFADLYAENLPLVNTIEIKNRLKTIVPPEIIEAGKTGKMPEQAHTPNAQDQAAMAEVQYKQQQIEIEKQKLQIQLQEQQAKLMQVEMELEVKKMELAAQLEEQKLRYLAETDRTRSDNAISHADNLTKILTASIKEKEKKTNGNGNKQY